MIEKATERDLQSVVDLAGLLWPESEREDLTRELRALLANADCAVFLWRDGTLSAGFAQCQLRHDYVEGTDSSPVGYLEGIYVLPEYRGKGVASALLKAGEAWAKGKGCLEFASDCELSNRDSLAFHLRMGFSEANRIICFTKAL